MVNSRETLAEGICTRDRGTTVVRPLRKIKLDGSPYQRRAAVESEIEKLSAISASELERRASIWPSTTPDFLSPEALVHFVRTTGHGTHRDRLIESLLQRIFHLTPRANGANELTVSLTKTNIRDDVVDHFIDLLLSDQATYDERLDYYEINFNSAIAKDRLDACELHWKHENRSKELGADEDEVSDTAEVPTGGYDPFDLKELDYKFYRLRLDEAIDSLPELQRRIVEMLRRDFPIESKDPSVNTISKALGKAEKTIRTHRDKAFKSLRLRLERKGKL